MSILTWIVMGLIVGLIARFILPNPDAGGFFTTIALGIAGAFAGGLIGKYLGLGSVTGFNLVSFLLALGGAVILLGAHRIIKK